MESNVLPVHSLAEAYLYLRVTPCTRCSAGPLQCLGTPSATLSRPGYSRAGMSVVCGACGNESTVTFEHPERDEAQSGRLADIDRVNPTRESSRVLDVGQWLTLFRIILEMASKESDRRLARRQGYQAAQCLEEALKFYEDGNDLPPETALFQESSRQRLHDRPDLFARQRLLALRSKLPTLAKMEQQITRDAKAGSTKRRWLPGRRTTPS